MFPSPPVISACNYHSVDYFSPVLSLPKQFGHRENPALIFSLRLLELTAWGGGGGVEDKFSLRSTLGALTTPWAYETGYGLLMKLDSACS